MRIIFILFVTANLAHACDLRVVLRDYDGSSTDAQVAILDANGGERSMVRSQNGVAEFCDVGLGEFTVVVSGEHCGQVYVRRLGIRPGSTREVPVYFRNCHGFTLLTGCDVLVRLTDPAARNVAEARIVWGGRTYRTDRFGRVVLHMKRNTEVQLIAMAPGMKETRETFTCGPEYSEAEKILVMPFSSAASPEKQ